MSRKIKVKYKDTQTEYSLMDDSNHPGDDSKAIIKGKFIDWNGNTPTKLEITKNNYASAEIFSVVSIVQSDCKNGNCDELQANAKNGQNNTGQFTIKNKCTLNNTQFVLVIWKDENTQEKCSNCYKSGVITPDTKKGNILQGGN